MKISNSKRQLAKLLIEDGVTQLPEGANWVAQDKGRIVWPYGSEPSHDAGSDSWSGSYLSMLAKPPTLIANWHQTALSRAEFDQIVAETAPDADGWIEWKGGECPVEVGALIDVKYRDLHVQLGSKVGERSTVELYATSHWRNSGGAADIIAYRLHNPEKAKSTAVGDDETNLESKEELEAMELRESAEVRANLAKIYAPSIESLAADYRNKLGYAGLKQDEADKAKAESGAALSELEKAIAAIGFAITPIGVVAQESELVITDWRDLQIGDVIFVDEHDGYASGECEVINMEHPGCDDGYVVEVMNACRDERWIDVRVWWRFIRRPAK